MFRPHYQIHTPSGPGTHFEKQDILDPFKKFLARHSIPAEIVQDVSFSGNAIYVKLKKGSANEHGNEMDAVFKTLSTSKFAYSLMRSMDLISCWVPFLEDIVEANNQNENQYRL